MAVATSARTNPDDYDVIVVGAGLAGLSCAFELAENGLRPLVLEARPWTGGRTASWTDPDGMEVESGLHRVPGVYTAFPDLLTRAGLMLDDVITWEKEIEFRQPSPLPSLVLSADPLRRPFEMLSAIFDHSKYLSPLAKLSLGAIMTAGVADHAAEPERLDAKSLLDYAVEMNAHPQVIAHVLEPLAAGVYFVSARQLSAYVFMALVAPYVSVSQAARLRVGAFSGGMTRVMTDPLAAAIRRRGGEVRTGVAVEELIVEQGRVTGVRGATGPHRARQVVLASSLRATQALIAKQFSADGWAASLLRLPTMPAVTLQLELNEPCMKTDHTAFGVGTSLACYSEQSRTTFKRETGGRLSIILAPADQLIGLPETKLMEIVLEDADRLGLQIRDGIRRHRVVTHVDDFYSLLPGHDHLRPLQVTPVPGLALAGDYTRQKFAATMEGAVVSGRLAAEAVMAGLGANA